MAGLRDSIQADLVAAFQVGLDDIPEYCEYHAKNAINPDYDPSTGTVTQPADAVYTFDAVYSDAKEELVIDVPVQEKDAIVIFPSSYVNTVPKINDYLINKDNIRFHVIAVVTDPANAHYSLHVRPSDV